MTGTFSIKTLGCKFNQYESSLIVSALSASGWRVVPFGERADIVVVNTCTVTDSADKKCRNYIRQGARFASTGGVIVVGCLQRRAHSDVESMPEVKGIVDNSDREHLAGKIIQAAGFVFDGSDLFSEDDSLPFGRVRSFIRVQDGCDGKCSYCIVPSVRGNPVSRPFEDVMRHARKSIEHGVKELVLTGITIGRYESGGYDLAGLAESIMNIEGDFRIRITSIEPRHMNEKLASLFASPKLAPHSHLPLQSGSDRILSRMNRPYNRQEFIDVVNLIRTKCPDIAIGTDIIVGYPGETDNDFEQTLALVRDMSFSYVHQFTYSARSGTPSSADKGCDHRIVMSRSKELRTMTDIMTREYADSFIGKHDMAVIERDGEGLAARTGHYLRLPLAAQGGVLPGDYREVEIRSIDDTLKAIVVSD